MTHAELYEIVKDNRDVWGKQLEWDGCQFIRRIGDAVYSLPGLRGTRGTEMELLGLGVEWLVKNSDVTIHEHLHGGIVVWPQLEPGYDNRPKVIRPTLLAAVYAAIAEVKRGKADSTN